MRLYEAATSARKRGPTRRTVTLRTEYIDAHLTDNLASTISQVFAIASSSLRSQPMGNLGTKSDAKRRQVPYTTTVCRPDPVQEAHRLDLLK